MPNPIGGCQLGWFQFHGLFKKPKKDRERMDDRESRLCGVLGDVRGANHGPATVQGFFSLRTLKRRRSACCLPSQRCSSGCQRVSNEQPEGMGFQSLCPSRRCQTMTSRIPTLVHLLRNRKLPHTLPMRLFHPSRLKKTARFVNRMTSASETT